MTWKRWAAVAAWVLMIASAAVAWQTNGPVQYIYDELGRLIAVVDANGNSAFYSYDAVGNILSISRYTASQAAVFNFTPKSGPVGTNVTIYGSGFSATASQDAVAFNGTRATVISASTIQLVVAVPTGATTGPLTITSPAGSVTTTNSFTVTSTGGQPHIDSFSPQIVNAGTSVSIAGGNFDPTPQNDRLVINATENLRPGTASASSLTVTTPAATGSGRISLSTPTGAVTAANDLFIAPTANYSQYTVNNTGFTGRTSAGTSATVSIGTASNYGLLLFDGARGQMVSAVASGATFNSCRMFLLNTNNVFLPDARNAGQVAAGNCVSGGFYDSQMLPATGTYALLIDPQGGTGHTTVTPYVFSDVSGSITAGGPTTTVTTTVPGQNIILSFPGQVNQHVSLSIANTSFTGACFITIVNPDGTSFSNGADSCSTGSTFYNFPLLSQAGTYTLIFDPQGAATGSITFTLNNADDVTGTITTDGTPISFTTTVPGQAARYTFSGTAGQHVTALLDNSTYSQFGDTMSILTPSGSTFAATNPTSGSQFLDDARYCGGSAQYLCGATTLPATGTYTLLVQPGSSGTGSARVRVFAFAGDVTASGTLGGAQIPITIATPGQNAFITFSGTQGGRVTATYSGAAVSGEINSRFLMGLVNPDGSLFASPFGGGPFPFSGSSGFLAFNDIFTLPSTGTYTLIVDPEFDTTVGTMNLTLYNATDISLNVNADGSGHSVTTTAPGQAAHLNFTPTVGQTVSALFTNITYPSHPGLTLQMINGGSVSNEQGAGSDGANVYLAPFTISQSGNYSLYWQPNGTDTGSATISLYTVNNINSTVDTSNDPTTVTTTVPGQQADITFTATAGQNLTFSVSNSNFVSGRCNVLIKNPNGTTWMGWSDCWPSSGQWSHSGSAGQTGTYTILVAPVQSATGNMTVSVQAH